MKVVPIKEFVDKFTDFKPGLITTALNLMNIPYLMGIAEKPEEIVSCALKLTESHNWGEDFLVLYGEIFKNENDPTMPGRWLCACFKVATEEDFAHLIAKVDNMKAFL
jgi:hypothetical protein